MEKKRQKGPFDVFGTPLVLQAMPPHFDPDMEPEVKIPVWLRLVDLPLDLWNLTAVSKIASYIGTPLTTDFKTLRRESMDGLRIQVIVNTAQRPREAISILLPSGDYLDLKIEYEFMPKYCPSCKVFGPLLEECIGHAEEWQLVGRNGAIPRSRSRGRSKSASRYPNSLGPQNHKWAPEQQPSFRHRPWVRTKNQWRPKGDNFHETRHNPMPSVLRGVPLSTNKFGPLTTEDEAGTSTVPPRATVNDFISAVVQLAGQQAQDKRGRSKSRDPRIAAKERKEIEAESHNEEVGIQICGGEPAAMDLSHIQEKQIHEREPKDDGSAEGTVMVKKDRPGTSKGQATIAEYMKDQEVEDSERHGLSGKKKGDGKKKKGRDRSTSRTRSKAGETPKQGEEDIEDDPGPAQ